MEPSLLKTTGQVALDALRILGICLFYTSPFLLVGYFIHRFLRAAPCRYAPETPPEKRDDPAENSVPKRRVIVPAPGWDERDREESWDRDRRRRYGRHQHKHGRHHRCG